MDSWQGKVAVVTNCESNLGVSIIEELSKFGVITIGFRRNENITEAFSDKVKNSTKKGKIFLCKCDISNYRQLEAAVKKIIEDYGGIDILICNDSSTENCKENDDLKNNKKVIESYIFDTVACVRLISANMVERKARGQIVFVNNPLMNDLKCSFNLKEPTKAAVSSINELLRLEFRYLNANVKTTFIQCKNIIKEDATIEGLMSEDITKAIMAVIDTSEHLHIHEMVVQ